jgi:hypothetical protein
LRGQDQDSSCADCALMVELGHVGRVFGRDDGQSTSTR